MNTTSRAFAFSLLAATLTTTLAASSAHAEDRIKLATLAPTGSPWHNLLKEMGQKWSEASNGQVKLIIYPGGALGNEGDLVKKMRINQLQAAALTTIGLHEIASEPQAVDVPMMVQSWDELDYVMGKIGPQLEAAVADKGYIVLGWSEVGFVRFFSTKKYDTLASLIAGAKVFTWEGDPASADAWRAGGFHPVVMSSTDIVPSLQTGLIDTVATAPLYAFTTHMFERAKYMMDTPWAVLTGAMVIRKDAWEKLAPDMRAKLLDITHTYNKRISEEVRRMDRDALTQMQGQGLVVVHASDAANFIKVAQGAYSQVRGRVTPAATFDAVQKLVAEARAKHGK